MMLTKPPTVETYLDGDNDLLLICPWCGFGHSHGAGGMGLQGGGHRSPHCGIPTALPNPGYILNVVGRATPDFRKEWERINRGEAAAWRKAMRKRNP